VVADAVAMAVAIVEDVVKVFVETPVVVSVAKLMTFDACPPMLWAEVPFNSTVPVNVLAPLEPVLLMFPATFHVPPRSVEAPFRFRFWPIETVTNSKIDKKATRARENMRDAFMTELLFESLVVWFEVE
jgi:hypothetical protein